MNRRLLIMIKRPLVVAMLSLWLFPAAPAIGAPHGEATGEHGGAHGGGHSPIENMFGFWQWYNNKTAIPPFGLMLFNFGIFASLIVIFAHKPIRAYTAARSRTIASQLEESAKLRKDAQEKLDEYSTRLNSLEAEIKRMITEIRDEADAEKQRILSDADERAERMQRDAEQQIQAEILRVRVSLEKETVLAAVALAEKSLREKTNDKDQKALVSQFLEEVKSSEQGRRTS